LKAMIAYLGVRAGTLCHKLVMRSMSLVTLRSLLKLLGKLGLLPDPEDPALQQRLSVPVKSVLEVRNALSPQFFFIDFRFEGNRV
jgi:hypothetical protein